MKTIPLAAAVCAALCLLAPGTSAQDLFLANCRILPIDGPEIPLGHVLLRGGKIEAFGQDLKPVDGVPVLDATGKVVMPGFIIPQTSNGMDRPNEMMPVVPFVSARDSMDPSNPFFEDALRDGHLSILVIPSERTVIGGMGLVVHPCGLTVEEMTVAGEAGLKLSLVPSDGNRAAHLAMLRKALEEAKRHLDEKVAAAGDQRPDSGSLRRDLEELGVDKRQAPVVRMLEKELPAYIACATAGDVVQAIRLIEEYQLDGRLVLGPGTWRAAELIAAKKLPVILGPTLSFREKDPESGKTVTRELGRIFHEAGVTFTVTTEPASLGARYLWYQAAMLVRQGLTRDEALRAVTLDGAKVLGLGDRKGSIAKGKDADLVVLTADPLSGMAWVDQAIVGGKVVYERLRDPRLAEVFGTGSR